MLYALRTPLKSGTLRARKARGESNSRSISSLNCERGYLNTPSQHKAKYKKWSLRLAKTAAERQFPWWVRFAQMRIEPAKL